MTHTEQDDAAPQTGRAPKNPRWLLWLIAGALVLGCASSLGALLLLRRANSLDWLRDRGPFSAATNTSPPPAENPATATAVATATPTPAPTETDTPAATATPTAAATPTQPPAATPPPTATQTTAAQSTSAPTASPTPFVCDSLYELAGIQLAPGQTFQCTTHEQELTDLANSYPDSPCSQIRFGLDDGEIDIECRMGLLMRATLATHVDDCRLQIEVVRGTPGFRQIVQELIATQFNVIRYDTICVDRADVDDGELTVSGFGR